MWAPIFEEPKHVDAGTRFVEVTQREISIKLFQVANYSNKTFLFFQ